MEEELVMAGSWGLETRIKKCSCEMCQKIEEVRQSAGLEYTREVEEAVQLAIVQSDGPMGFDLLHTVMSCLPLERFAPLRAKGNEVFNAWLLNQAVQTGLYAGWGNVIYPNPLKHGGVTERH